MTMQPYKDRPGCVTAYAVFLGLVGALFGLGGPLFAFALQDDTPSLEWVFCSAAAGCCWEACIWRLQSACGGLDTGRALPF